MFSLRLYGLLSSVCVDEINGPTPGFPLSLFSFYLSLSLLLSPTPPTLPLSLSALRVPLLAGAARWKL